MFCFKIAVIIVEHLIKKTSACEVYYIIFIGNFKLLLVILYVLTCMLEKSMFLC